MSVHSSHPDIINRLKRAEGHIKSIIKMLEENRGCLDVAQQLHAVEKSITNAKKTLVHDHIDHCLNHAINDNTIDSNEALKEFKDITKYL
ncbi:MAG TPA: metal-sensing transcriptional repressor [Sulfuricurvum sp.]|nr:MAG: nickel resistance protein [Campylobacterales bacterium 16-40-21]OZA01909.1 MAG: nickel resistance protein [Sulfuricurvum sp. 17-40-25]HQS67895.1 metal-sensing transcriptional repressor [Sulfuricurvum sp.]HQT37198.1 metal-sensing transcriptional repressor [Sulfuricurvum sp.]